MSTATPSTAGSKHAAQYASDTPAVKSHLLLILWSVLPLIFHVPTNINIIVTASITVYTGCWRSIKAEGPTESMTKGDAMRFPIVGSCVLFGLFLLFKFLPAYLVNALLSFYLGAIAVVVLTTLFTPYIEPYFPPDLRVKQFAAPPFKIPHLLDCTEEPLSASLPQLCVGVVAAAFCSFYFLTKFWFANNVLGIAFSLEAIEHLSLGSVQTGTILLVGLFFYDIFWVFCTPVMVSVAKNFDAPIKLLFPRLGDLIAGKRPFAMLGLGDIAIPGVFVALMLRYDVQNGFRTRYFQSCIGGYVLGLITTIVVMNVFHAAQPALLYIVPGMLCCTFTHAWLAGEFKQVFNFSEAPEQQEKPKAEDNSEADKPEPKKEK